MDSASAIMHLRLNQVHKEILNKETHVVFSY